MSVKCHPSLSRTLCRYSHATCTQLQYPLHVALSDKGVERIKEVEDPRHRWSLIAAIGSLYSDGHGLSLDPWNQELPLNNQSRPVFLYVRDFAPHDLWFQPTGCEFGCVTAIASLPNGGECQWLQIAEDTEEEDIPF